MNLRPADINTPPNFYCVDKPGAQKIEGAFEKLDACQKSLKEEGSGNGSTVVIVGIGAAILGFFLGQSVR